MDYVKILNQPHSISKPIKKANIKNLAGGHAFKEDDHQVLNRWLLTGSAERSFYEGAQERIDAVFPVIERLAAKDVWALLDQIRYGSKYGLRPSPALIALAYLSGLYLGISNADVAKHSFDIIRTASHLYEYVAYRKSLRGGFGSKGGIFHRTLRLWLKNRDPSNLEYQFVKYRQRGGVSARDVLRIAKPAGDKGERDSVFSWVAQKDGWKEKVNWSHLPLASAYESLKSGEILEEDVILRIIKEKRLTHEMIPANISKTPKIWKQLYESMPVWATIRNLGNLTSKGLFDSKDAIEELERRLNKEAILKASVHPVQTLLAYATYKNGKGDRGRLTWTPKTEVATILENSIGYAFGNLPHMDGHVLNIVDDSGSMAGGWDNRPAGLPPYVIGVFMATVLGSTFKYGSAMAFSTRATMVQLSRDYRRSHFPQPRMGGTDPGCAIDLMIHDRLDVDMAIMWTDMQGWAGYHPFEKVREYRQKVNKDTKFVYVCVTDGSDQTTLADPDDPLQWSLGGFSADTPRLIEMIYRGQV